jgi:hypothetical protein
MTLREVREHGTRELECRARNLGRLASSPFATEADVLWWAHAFAKAVLARASTDSLPR